MNRPDEEVRSVVWVLAQVTRRRAIRAGRMSSGLNAKSRMSGERGGLSKSAEREATYDDGREDESGCHQRKDK